MNICEAIRKDHEHQRLLLKILVETSGETEPRKQYYADLKAQLEQHAIAEERMFYAPLMESDKTIDTSRHGIAEHHKIDKFIATLDDTEMSSPVWLKTLKSLQHLVEHHLDEEENEFFKQADEVLSSDEKIKLGVGYKKEMGTVSS